MNISLNWLKQHIDGLDKIDPNELGLKLTMATVEVEEVRMQAESLDGVVVGEILEIKKHPDADKLSIAQVDVGEEKPRQIVFGQMVEMKSGKKVPVALAPTVLPGNLEIKQAKLRGELSQGMLCLDQELGLAQEGVSIQFFEQQTKNGTPVVQVLNLDDVIYEVENKSLTNRPDLWGHYGMAREVVAIYDLKLKDYKLEKIKPQKLVDLKVSVEDSELCPRYLGVAIKGIKITESPDWLKQRLEAIGQKSINNIVDITNYIMYDLGQPLHAFSADKIKNDKIIVRRAVDGEKLITLDEEQRILTEDDLVIADSDKAVALAGIMGNVNSEIDDKTEVIIIESANFDATTIRKTSERLGLRSEASMRFEKSLDPNMAELAIKKAVNLILELIPAAEVVSEIVDAKDFKLDQGPLELTWDFIDRIIGQSIEPKKVIKILTGLGFDVKNKTQGIKVKIPTWRATKDVSIKEDIIEEITRIFGYDNLKPKMPAVNLEYQEENKLRNFERKIKDILSLSGASNEVYNSSFVSKKLLQKIGQTIDHLELENPWNEDECLMRKSLVPNLLQNVVDNTRFYDQFSLFEIGKVFINDQQGELVKKDSEEHLPSQLLFGAGAVHGQDPEVFYQTKGLLETLFAKLNIRISYKESCEVPVWCHPRQTLMIFIDKKEVGYVATLHPAVAKNLEIDKNTAVWEFNLNKIVDQYLQVKKFVPLPKFPAVELDLSIIVAEEKQWKDIRGIVKTVDQRLIQRVQLLDVFKNDKIEVGKKSVTFRITYQANDCTLEMADVNKLQEKVVEQLKNGVGAEIRS
ncbi:phenylalanine--tRNA ligase subunit beta [Candidatus Kuenenbacteria bacterium]|nr:phenylalanine--tRNA ligase subunit beta [Candidatus Kuenenbacteria bacterium]